MSSPKRKAGRHRIYMNVGYLLTEDQLRSYFSQFGPLLDVYLPKHKSGRNKGFGFTTFENEIDLEQVLRATEHVIDGVIVKINRAGPRPEHDPQSSDCEGESRNGGTNGSSHNQSSLGEGPRIYVGGIPDEISEDELREHFCKWGAVVDIYFPGKKGQKRVNYCFVTFDHLRAAQRACNESERNISGKALQSISIAEERLAEQRADTRANATAATALASFLNCAQPIGYSHVGNHQLSLQALSQSLSGLNFYPPRMPDPSMAGMYGGVVAAPQVGSGALLDGLTGTEGSFMAPTMMPNMHAMHAAALQQAQVNAQLAASMGGHLTMDPSMHSSTALDGMHRGVAPVEGMDGSRPMWAWARTRSTGVGSPTSGSQNSYAMRNGSLSSPAGSTENGHVPTHHLGIRGGTAQFQPPYVTDRQDFGEVQSYWYPQANGHSEHGAAVSGLHHYTPGHEAFPPY